MKIGIDVDDVVVDLHTPWLAAINKECGTNWQASDMTEWEFYKPWNIAEEVAIQRLTPELYSVAKPHEGALEVVNELRRLGHEIVYITSAPDLQHWLAKSAWLTREGFLLPRDQAFPVGKWATYKTKREVGQTYGIPVLVDDSAANCRDWAGVAYLLSRNHNRSELYMGKRLRKFGDIVQELKWLPAGLTNMMASPSMVELIPPQTTFESIGDSKPTNPKDAIATDKVPLHFVSGIVKAYAAIAHFLGNVKYGSWNYRAGGARASIYKAALDRHMDKWWEGQKYDKADGTPHLANALACINILIECSENGTLVDDRPPSQIEQLEAVYAEVEQLMPKVREKYKDRKPRHFTIKDTAE